MLDNVALVNMNGRIQSWRGFLSPDPLTGDPGNTQDFNRYAYVGNNPLTFVDPSGFSVAAPPKRDWPKDDVNFSFSGAEFFEWAGAMGHLGGGVTGGGGIRQPSRTTPPQVVGQPAPVPAGPAVTVPATDAVQPRPPGDDRKNSNFHEYVVTTQICDSARQFGCSAWYVFKEGLDRYSAPGLDGSYIKNGETRNLPGFGKTSFIVDEKNMKITNVTQPGHILYPGYVERQVLALDGRVLIQTRGVGTGNFGSLNVAGANIMWHSVDAQIANSLNGLFPPTRIVP
jgi:hypothetical protein